MIVFRVDANGEIGEGHLMRCVAIAKELPGVGEEAIFITADESPAALLKREGLAHIALHTDWRRVEEELPRLLQILSSIQAGCVFVDSYSATPGYFGGLKGKAVTAYMDDFGAQAYPVDILVNCNAYSDSIPYEKMYADTGARLLLGPAYTPLRAEFRLLQPKQIADTVTGIMITTGSTDPYGVSAALVRRIIRDDTFNGAHIHAVVGRYYTNSTELNEIARSDHRVILHENVADMAEIMRLCDIAVSAGGTTVYELCACGVPAVLFGFADNQTRIREYFAGRGAMIDCGDCRLDGETCLGRIMDALKVLASKSMRETLRGKAANIVDGQGAVRQAACLAKGY